MQLGPEDGEKWFPTYQFKYTWLKDPQLSQVGEGAQAFTTLTFKHQAFEP